MQFTVLTWNIRFALGSDGRRDPARIVDRIAAEDADIVFLQECDDRFGRRASLPLPLLGAAGYRPARAGGRSLGWRGNAVLVRRGVPVAATRRVPLAGFEIRGALMLALPQASVACVHLGLLRFHRRRQLREVLAALEGMGGPHLVAGDFNEWRRRGLRLPPGWRMAAPGPTFPSRRPLLPLDRVLVGPGLHVEEAEVVRAAGLASDHLPVRARIRRG
ncbi:endonuclease/exonuclease/phosphatase family metal-dependent hydrolase [Hasllibacter halocynthiae]|uniref:Endonuclease/exonuclease/phosphatase family metal-dependent hydrolase n=1 Tax=Hasllibacter halocynthiae TaxID=595589 RepID=A0A2T0X2J6_9RHOB|nr:endonuclease/exonuclease/phosphatase family protein [Hasllibacter halocynthiae]PRY93158.1 endonuclease/exonuclease/phosphatase family metal-dependent hydrolase [Hasllibacter halocynthiae]